MALLIEIKVRGKEVSFEKLQSIMPSLIQELLETVSEKTNLGNFTAEAKIKPLKK